MCACVHACACVFHSLLHLKHRVAFFAALAFLLQLLSLFIHVIIIIDTVFAYIYILLLKKITMTVLVISSTVATADM